MSDAPPLRVDTTGAGIAFWIHVTPRSSKPRIGGVHDGALRVAVREPPVDGRANAACAEALARALGEARRAVHIPADAKSRRKRVEVDGDAASLRERVCALASNPGVR